jgi:hypothetical protein
MSNNLVLVQTPALDTNNPSNRCKKAGVLPVAWGEYEWSSTRGSRQSTLKR